jgi:PleD family two-component response regulator
VVAGGSSLAAALLRTGVLPGRGFSVMLSVWHLNVQVHNRFYEKAKIILIVEDDADIGSFLVAALQQETPFHPILVNDGFAALKTVHDVKPDLVCLA